MSADNWANCCHCDAEWTFREDWEIGLFPNATTVFISYTGRCQSCGASAQFETDLPVLQKARR